jgi:hypothetical protein
MPSLPACLLPHTLFFMHIPRWFIWLLLYAAATFAWIVFFEHGAVGERYRDGARYEWDRLWNAGSEWIGRIRGS